MMNCEKMFLIKCQQCLFLRLVNCQHLLRLNVCNWEISFFFSRDFSYHIPNYFNRCFMIDFRIIRSP